MKKIKQISMILAFGVATLGKGTIQEHTPTNLLLHNTLPQEVKIQPSQHTSNFFSRHKSIAGITLFSVGAIASLVIYNYLNQKEKRNNRNPDEKKPEQPIPNFKNKQTTDFQFPLTIPLKDSKKEIPFVPNLNKEGLPVVNEQGEIEGNIYYVSGTEKSLSLLHRKQPSWKTFPAKINKDKQFWSKDIDEKVEEKIKAMPSVYGNNKIARPYLFFNTMGIMEAGFQKTIEKKTDLSKFPLLSAIKAKNGDSAKIEQTSAIKNELKNFPERKYLLESKFYRLPCNTKLKKEKKKGKLDQNTFDAEQIYNVELKNNTNKELPRRIALRKTDIRYIQGDYLLKEKNNDKKIAVQLASTKNCLEGGMENGRLEDMQYGSVQGENGAMGGMPGSIIRKYCIDEKDRTLFDTTKTKKIKNREDLLKNVYVGVHENVAITSGYSRQVSTQYEEKNNTEAGSEYADWLKDNAVIAENRFSHGNNFLLYNSTLDNPPRVHQIFTAAYDRSKKHGELCDDVTDQQAKDLLYAMYRGTIVAAANLDVDELFLTYVGCGAYGNQSTWIDEIFKDQAIQELIEKSGMTVYLVKYKEPHKLK